MGCFYLKIGIAPVVFTSSYIVKPGTPVAAKNNMSHLEKIGVTHGFNGY
jgi:hypothetical protein